MASEQDEEIVMTPSKKGKATHIRIERQKKKVLDLDEKVAHVGGGQNKGLVIQKQQDTDDVDAKPQVQLGFNCFLVDQKTGQHVVESRKLKFWYVETADYLDQVTTAFNFFRELLKPENFPKDYVGFIKKCMKLMQKIEYKMARKIYLEVKQLEEDEAPLSPGLVKHDTRPQEEIIRERLLQVLESAYPNILAVEDLVRIVQAEESMVLQQLAELKQRELVREMETGGFVRRVLDDKTEVQEVKQMPTIAANQQPTIAIITANYYEKVAVDAMMQDKTTFVRFKTGGESHVYTIGFIGEHKVVSTKLPAIGHHRAAQISAGNTTTRLLGTFQNIEHVLIVGVAGGMPHYTDYFKHVRLGDVVISTCNKDGKLYYYCDKILQDKDGKITYHSKSWGPKDQFLQQVVKKMKDATLCKKKFAPWEKYIQDGLELLSSQEADFNRPPPNTDRLTMSIGDGNVIEVQHPDCPDETQQDRKPGMPKIHFGVYGSGKTIAKEYDVRLDFAGRYDLVAIDSEFDQVLESIHGNRKDSYIFIRGVSDYSDGSRNKEWLPYAALAAAAVTKSIVKSFANPHMSEDEL
ncbi:hypothetical protein CHS0354_022076 [Potamilus streckersoni]|uniref:Winged helix-turn-helix domain-containing protein n=1 Tax=Potamilus streckersoni TaxID=2493646 RepID=A0AAE0SSV7_9BIVA|nr:hypothetical protein CHS0354_022076 [Potamilus streckersoni]